VTVALFESIGRRTLHPFLSRKFDDRLSRLMLRSATSLPWNIAALGALFSFAILFSQSSLGDSSARSVTDRVLIAYAVLGVVWNAFSACVHSASSGRYGRGLLLFAIWPLSFAYNWREVLRSRHARTQHAA
jgi:hypothetical protein